MAVGICFLSDCSQHFYRCKHGIWHYFLTEFIHSFIWRLSDLVPLIVMTLSLQETITCKLVGKKLHKVLLLLIFNSMELLLWSELGFSLLKWDSISCLECWCKVLFYMQPGGFLLFFQFVMYLHWWWFSRGIKQIWLEFEIWSFHTKIPLHMFFMKILCMMIHTSFLLSPSHENLWTKENRHKTSWGFSGIGSWEFVHLHSLTILHLAKQSFISQEISSCAAGVQTFGFDQK